MTEYVPFVNTSTDVDLVEEYYSDCEIVRVALCARRTIESVAQKRNLWIDPGIDGYHRLLDCGWPDPFSPPKRLKDPTSPEAGYKPPPLWWTQYTGYIRRFDNWKLLAYKSHLKRPDKRANEFVESVLDACVECKPTWLTVPQLPLTKGNERNAMNKRLAKAYYVWHTRSPRNHKAVLPVILTNQNQYLLKRQRDAKIRAVISCQHAAGASKVWVVDADLSDQKGMATYEKRFAALASFHEELKQGLPSGVALIAGPYWGMNLILWAKGLADVPAVGVGGGYQYQVAGGQPRTASVRLPLPPLRRWAESKARELETWLKDALSKLSRNDDAYAAFAKILNQYSKLRIEGTAKRELAQYYKRWLDELASVPPAGRAVALYQSLSSAFVLGKQLPNLPEKGPSRHPEIVARQLMLNCL